MKFRDHSVTKRAEMQLAPMIDVVFLLLIFFIVSWNFARFESDQEVEVPDAVTADQRQRKPGEIIINVRNSGDIRIGGETVPQNALERRLSELARKYPDQPIILRGHKTVSFEHVMKVLDACKKAGIWNVAFAAEMADREAAP